MRLRVLGAVELVGRSLGSGEEPAGMPPRSPKVRRLLAALLVRANSVAGVDWLADVLWAEQPPASVEGALYTLVSRLRRDLRAAGGAATPAGGADGGGDGTGPALLTRAPGYLLRVGRGDVDAGRFSDQVAAARACVGGDPAGAAALLDEALGLWRGPAYAEFAAEDFARAEAARLEELRVSAREERVAAALALGQHDDAVARLEELLAENPLRERPHAQLMLALYRTGRQADALQTYRRYRARLGEELGLEPSADLQRLETAILRQANELAGPPTPPAWALPAAAPAPAARPAPPTRQPAAAHPTSPPPATAAPTPPDAPAPPLGPAAPGPPAPAARPTPPARQPAAAQPTSPPPATAAPTPTPAPTPPDAPAPPPAAAPTPPPPLGNLGNLGNLPVGLPALVGRGEVLGQVEGALGRARVLTLTGPGGVGKTSLALHLAARVAGGFPDGGWVAELASLDDPAAVTDAVATVLAVGRRPEPTATERLVGHLRPRKLLLVLDNCEHVVEAAARLADALVGACPDVTVLATSREPLGIDLEHVWPVAPLAVPPPGLTDSGEIIQNHSVALFVTRARAAAPEFTLEGGNAGQVGEICRRLDGLPLAIELAASRMRSLSPAEVTERLGARFRFLRSTRRLAAERHRTLQAVVDWSYGLLSEEERRCFDRLSVFAGDFPLSAAEHVAGLGHAAGDHSDVADLLASLVDKSLLLAVTSAEGPTRYAMLETMRAYGRERLALRGETDEAARAHADHYVALAREASSTLLWPDATRPRDILEREIDELRAAHAWALEHDLDLAILLVATLFFHAEHRMPPEFAAWAERTAEAASAAGGTWPLLAVVWAVAAIGARFRGELDQAAALAERGLAAAPPGDFVRRFPLLILMDTAGFQGRVPEAERHATEIEGLALAGGDDVVALFAAMGRAQARAYSGDDAGATATAERARSHAERSGSAIALAWSYYMDGEVRLETDPERAAGFLEEALARGRGLDDHYLTGVALLSVASLRARHGDPREALPLFGDVVAHWHRAGVWTQQWMTIRSVVDLLVRVGADRPAAVLYGALFSRTNAAPPFGADADRLAAARQTLIARSSSETFETYGAEGAAMADDAVIAYTRSALAEAHGERADRERTHHEHTHGVRRSGT